MCKVVKWKYSSHIIYELCFHLAFGCLDICLVRVKKSGSLTECPTAYKSIASFFSQSPSSPAYAFDSKRKYFCMRHWTCSVFGEYLRMCFFSFSLKTMQKSTPCTLSVLCWLVDVRTIKTILAEILWINVSYEINLEVNLFLCVCVIVAFKFVFPPPCLSLQSL